MTPCNVTCHKPAHPNTSGLKAENRKVKNILGSIVSPHAILAHILPITLLQVREGPHPACTLSPPPAPHGHGHS